MAVVQPLRAIRYAPEHVRLGGVLAPPYDVISPDQRARLYARDLRNVVRIDFGEAYPGDLPGEHDRYTRAADHLGGWLELGLLVREQRPSFYVSAHDFVTAEGRRHRRLGVLARVPALPWGHSDVLPHERTLRGPKEDRMALMRATHAQTSPVWAMWGRAPGLPEFMERIAGGTALLGGRIDGEVGSEKLRLWRVDGDDEVAELRRLFDPATLYIADGHHRFETAAAYAAERRAAGDAAGSDSQHTLIYASAADDPSMILLPTHRMLLPREGVPYSRDDLGYRLDDAWTMEPVDDPVAASQTIAGRRGTHHSFVVVAPDGAAILERPRAEPASPRGGLDVVILQEEILKRCGVGDVELREGALGYSRDPAEAVRAVGTRRAALAFLTSACTAGEVIAVADAGETMPQKSTYFYPKVPTGLVLSPL